MRMACLARAEDLKRLLDRSVDARDMITCYAEIARRVRTAY